ncbi:hypothetical protein AAC387_Pa01g3458 [Persea americana]
MGSSVSGTHLSRRLQPFITGLCGHFGVSLYERRIVCGKRKRIRWVDLTSIGVIRTAGCIVLENVAMQSARDHCDYCTT